MVTISGTLRKAGRDGQRGKQLRDTALGDHAIIRAICVAPAASHYVERETMFDNLTDRLSQTLRNISGRGRLTEDNIKDTLREVRMALLEADVALPVVREFINRVKERAVGHDVNKSLTPGQEFVKIVKNELVAAMGEENNTLNLAAQPPAVVLMAGHAGCR